ncbi:MAG: hypothetical protein AB1640_26005 [bacterium]
MRKSLSFSVSVLILAVALCSAGCMTGKDRVELGPLYARRPLLEEPGTEWSFLWPFFDGRSGEKVRQFGFRPVLNLRRESQTGREGDRTELQALWPLILYRQTEGCERRTLRLFPLVYHREFVHPEGREETDDFVLPFFLRGRSSDSEENYLALFPLAGSLRGLFGKDRIRFLLFPLYADSRDGEHRSRNFLWPFVQYSSGGGKSSFRVWPFYGRKEKEGSYKKTFVLWPFFAHVQERLGRERPLDSWYFLPFYGRQQTPFGKIEYFLYPFFSYQRNEAPGNRFREWNAPWPFFSIARGDRYRKTYLWPFWGRQERGSYERDFIAYPIYSHSVYASAGRMSEGRYLLPFYWAWSLTDRKEERTAHFKIWPILSRSAGLEDRRNLNVLSPLWFRDRDGFERNYGPLWTWYRHRSTDFEEEYRVLWHVWRSPGETCNEAGVGAAAQVPSGEAAPELEPELAASADSGEPDAREDRLPGEAWLRRLLGSVVLP